MLQNPTTNAAPRRGGQRRQARLVVDDERLSPSREDWEAHKEKIRDLYIRQGWRLETVREYMIRNYSFSASRANYRSNFNRWQMRRNLNPTDTGHIIQLMKSHRQSGRDVEIFLHGCRKTLADVNNYLDYKGWSEEHALGLIRGHPTPAYITACLVPDSVKMSTISPEASQFQAQHLPVSGDTYQEYYPASVAPLMSGNNHQMLQASQGSGHPWSVIDQNGKEPSLGNLEFDPAGSGVHPYLDTWNEDDPELTLIHTDAEPDDRRLRDTVLQTVVAGAAFGPYAADLLCPRSQQGTAEVYAIPSMYMSTCPPDAAGELAMILAQSYCRVEVAPISQQATLPDSERRNETYQFAQDSHNFLAKCIHGCMCESQGPSDEAQSLIGEAMGSLRHMVTVHAAECLSTLHLLVAFLDVHGQRAFAKRILTEAKRVSVDAVGPQSPITTTISFMNGLGNDTVGQTPQSIIDQLWAVSRSLSAVYGQRAPSTLTALYNIAWTLTEARKYPEAREILSRLQQDCEACFGRSHIQTVSAMTTLARVACHQENFGEANALMEEAMLRLKKDYRLWHPYRLEAMHRHAVFLFELKRIREAETVLRKVVYQRFAILGSQNPRSQQSFELLKKHMTQVGRQMEAENLFIEYADGKCVNKDYNEHPWLAY